MARRKRDYILPAWVGPVVPGPFESNRPQWRRCSGCWRQILTLENAPVCMACDPTKMEVQPGVFVTRPDNSPERQRFLRAMGK